jgi:hypothetical protein
MVQLQDSILEHLHHHTFSNMLSDEISEAHRAWILSCSSPRVGALAYNFIIFPSLLIIFPNFCHNIL